MNLLPVPTPQIRPHDDLFDIFCDAFGKKVPEKSVLVITSKVVSVAENSLFSFSSEKEFEQKIYSEADNVLGENKAYRFFLTEKKGMILPNAGIDKSNAPPGTAILLPKNPQKSADVFRQQLRTTFNLHDVGVVICDSRVLPFRQGITGVALAWSGFVGVSDERGKTDIFGRQLEVSRIAVADALATVAQLFFGQADERIPFVLCTNAPVHFTDAPQQASEACISTEDDLYADLFLSQKGTTSQGKKIQRERK